MKYFYRAASLATIRKKAVWGCRAGAAVIVMSALTACEQAPSLMLGPTATVTAAKRVAATSNESWGAEGKGTKGADVASGFDCFLGGVRAENSRATRSASGNETVVCTGETPARPDRAQHLDFPCLLHFGDGDPLTEDFGDSKIVVTPSGHVTLVCKS